ncbi:MAG TPA: hypothetical protein VNZ23_11660, partial [Xanthobacteraceae bacterium]|nr:hypothetical protein [Xanthobacteraceae bacterium]
MAAGRERSDTAPKPLENANTSVLMLQGWFIVVVALAYIGFLFLVASYGDRSRKRVRGSRARLLIYP